MSEQVGQQERRSVTPRELLDMRERVWGRVLRGVSLVAEVDVREDFSDQVAWVLGREYHRRLDAGSSVQVMFGRWPACVAVAMTAVAARRYRRGSYWPALWEAVKYDGHQEDQNVWGNGFREAIARLGLPEFAEHPLPYVGPILMHAGIPTYCVDDFYRLLLQRQARDPGMTGEDFLNWSTAPGKESRLFTLDMPARRFLEYGSEYALDVVERSLELLDRVRESDEDVNGVGLPERFVQRARELADDGLFAATPPPAIGWERRRQEHPRLVLDPYGRGVSVWLPSTAGSSSGSASWHVTADGEVEIVKSQAMWVGAAEGVPATSHPLSHPVRSVQVRLAGSEREYQLHVVDPVDPVLLFGEDGRHLPGTLSLPPGPVWAVYPADKDLSGGGSLRVLSHGVLPVGWTGWQLRLVDLSDATSLGLRGSARSRPVRGFTRPRVEFGEPVRGVTTPYGSPVFTQVPEVWLPGETDAETTWQVEVRSRATGQAIVSRSIKTTVPTTIVDLWDDVQRPLLGAFDVMIRGPLARGISRSVFIAERLTARYRPAIRLFSRGGLGAATAELSAPIGARVEPRVVDFTDHDLAHVVSYDVEDMTEPLVVMPPHVQVLHEQARKGSSWSTGALRLATESFREPGTLLVQVPGASALRPIRIVCHGRVLQDLDPAGPVRDGIARYELSRIADTVAEHQHADLILPLGERDCAIAHVRPARLASAVHHIGDRLVLSDAAGIEGMVAGVYLVAAPWREPYRLPVVDGRVALPLELRRCGPLRVVLRVDDPWVVPEWPRWPKPAQSFYCPSDGWFDAGNQDETALSRFLVGNDEFPTGVADLTRLWSLVDLASGLHVGVPPSRIRHEAARALAAQPTRAVSALLEAELLPERALIALITAGLATYNPGSAFDGGKLRRLWASIPAVAAMIAAPEDEAWHESAELECGDTFTAVLANRRDAHAAVGGFGADAQALDLMTPEQLDYVWQAASVVPTVLLDPDSRMTAARQLFDARNTKEAREAGRAARHTLSAVFEVIRTSEYPDLVEQVEARDQLERGGWWALPVMSAAAAIVARLAARGDEDAERCERQLRADWVRLATIAPNLVTIDLVLAELLLMAREEECE